MSIYEILPALDLYLFSDLIKQQLALSNYNEIEIDLFIVFPFPTQ